VTATGDGVRAILDFWFREIGPDRWWVRSADTDAAITQRFHDLWQEWRDRPAGDFLGSADDALAAIVLFDQFPRNMFRGETKAFSTDALGLALAKAAIARGYDRAMDEAGRSFFYLPFMHSEALADQDRSVALFESLGWADPARFARLHHDMIARNGRFPARNAALGRPDRPGEDEAIEESKSW
jgi:uncharacterized protein (DUF924 family)